MSVKKLTNNEFDSSVASGVALIDFYADWCGPCRMVSPIIEEIAKEHPELSVGKVNVDNEPELAREFSVFSIPTLVAIKGGKIVGRAVGARPKEDILALIG